MLNAGRVTPQTLRDQSRHRAQVLERAARRRAAANEAAAAIVLCWGCDVAMVQATLMEELVVQAHAPQRQYFAAVERLSSGLQAEATEQRSAADVVRGTRAELLAGLEAEVAFRLAAQFVDPAFLEPLAVPGSGELAALADRRVQGHEPGAFARQRVREATELMVQAQGEHMRGDDAAAIQTAYQSDFRALEAYLVQSAVAVGDSHLCTVEIRWELAVAAMQDLTGLSADFPSAVGEIRATLAEALGEPDASRLAAMMSPV